MLIKDWRRYLANDTVVDTEEYYIAVPTTYDVFYFRIRYVKHNGYTIILPVDHEHENLSKFGALFVDWFKWHQQFNTRYDKPGWWKPVRFNRKKKLVVWGVMSVEKAYEQFKQEVVDSPING
jgi:hypothetical protein